MCTIEFFLDDRDRFTGLDCRGTGQTANALATRLVGVPLMAIGAGKWLAVHEFILTDSAVSGRH
jgi:hypothetical protein